MEVQVAVTKVNKWASSSSGDTVEVVERSRGGVSVVMADGQGSGRGAKLISGMVARKVISLLAEGVRDGAAARAASDYLFSERHGRVSSTLNILSIDLTTQSLVVSRNNPIPMVIAVEGEITRLDAESKPIGLYRNTRPVINEYPLMPGLTAVIFTDGLVHAGSRKGSALDIENIIKDMICNDKGVSPEATPEATPEVMPEALPQALPQALPKAIADGLLERALLLDEKRPVDDISIAVLCVVAFSGDPARRLTLRLPLEG
jgi:serine phosphatase RsbU (regulator of sigma subunit)